MDKSKKAASKKKETKPAVPTGASIQRPRYNIPQKPDINIFSERDNSSNPPAEKEINKPAKPKELINYKDTVARIETAESVRQVESIESELIETLARLHAATNHCAQLIQTAQQKKQAIRNKKQWWKKLIP